MKTIRLIPFSLAVLLVFLVVVFAIDYIQNTDDYVVLNKYPENSEYILWVNYGGLGGGEFLKVSKSQYDSVERGGVVTIWNSKIFGVHIRE